MDIDIDISPSRRPVILQKIREERGRYFYKDIDDISRQHLGCTLVATFGTASSKRAIQVAGRGYRSEEYPKGLDIDTTKYLSSLIPSERGFVWGIKDAYYGADDKKPVRTFINEVDKYPGLLEIALGLEGLILSRGSHASGVIINDEDPYDHCGAYMRTPRGDVITQCDLHRVEKMGATKYDFLVTAVMDKLRICLELLQQNNHIPKGNLRDIWMKYLDPMKLDYDDKEVWNNINKGKILSLFQLDSPVGGQGVQQVHPQTLDEMTYLNGLIRLMGEEGEERPIEKFVRYKANPQLWYDEMTREGLTKEEQKAFEPYMKKSYGVCITQEDIMWGLMDKRICGMDFLQSTRCRKIISKKKMDQLEKMRGWIMEKATSPAVGRYVWKYMIGPSKGYSFAL